jgi:hypothetical protein
MYAWFIGRHATPRTSHILESVAPQYREVAAQQRKSQHQTAQSPPLVAEARRTLFVVCFFFNTEGVLTKAESENKALRHNAASQV